MPCRRARLAGNDFGSAKELKAEMKAVYLERDRLDALAKRLNSLSAGSSQELARMKEQRQQLRQELERKEAQHGESPGKTRQRDVEKEKSETAITSPPLMVPNNVPLISVTSTEMRKVHLRLILLVALFKNIQFWKSAQRDITKGADSSPRLVTTPPFRCCSESPPPCPHFYFLSDILQLHQSICIIMKLTRGV